MDIPKQLMPYRFCRIRHKSKKPFELAWLMLEEDYEKQSDGTWKHKETGELYKVTINKKTIPYTGSITNYSYEIASKFLGENYGVLTGKLRGFDDDTENQILIKLFNENFERTFRVRDHLYFEFTNGNQEKIIFYDKEGKHCGELQGKGQQCVGAGSVHLSGEIYDVRVNKPIIEIDYDKFIEVFKDYLPKKEVVRSRVALTNFEGDSLTDIPITNILSSDQDKCPSCGCATGTNFKVYPETNSYFCFHSHSGGSIWEAIAITERIKTCSEIGKSCLTESESKEIRDIAIKKYGLRIPEMQASMEPIGWALSINIKKMAQRKNMLNCLVCGNAFEFNEKLGWFKCQCRKGNLKKFAELCMRVRQ